jgi:Fe-Mn family superoxide dismutase
MFAIKQLSRRNFVTALGSLAAIGALAACGTQSAARELTTAVPAAATPRPAAATPGATPGATPAATGPYVLPPLSYAKEALEPHIDTLTMEIHHDRHHATYVTNLNAAMKDYPDLAAMSVENLLRNLNQVPESVRTAVRNNGGGHANHSLLWEIMGPGGGGEPTGSLGGAIKAAFASFDGFKDQFTKAATGRFGSGWAWLVSDGGALSVASTPNQDTPLMDGKTPILGLDVWEHAYYLKYQNKRADYIAAWFNVVRWDKVAARYAV